MISWIVSYPSEYACIWNDVSVDSLGRSYLNDIQSSQLIFLTTKYFVIIRASKKEEVKIMHPATVTLWYGCNVKGLWKSGVTPGGGGSPGCDPVGSPS